MIELILIALIVGLYLLSLRFAYWWGWESGSADAYAVAERLFLGPPETHVEAQRRVARDQ